MCSTIRKKVPEKFHITIDTKEIKIVKEFKYLGIILDPQLKFDTYEEAIQNCKYQSELFQINQVMFLILRQLIYIYMPWFFHICSTALL